MAESDRSTDALVLLPAYNDAELVGALTAGIMELSDHYRVLVIDDGSDEPLDVSTLSDGVLVCRLPTNLGLGVCTHIAFDHALKHGYGAMVRVDADGQHPLEAISLLLENLLIDEADMVVGARTNRNFGTGLRSYLSKIVRSYLSLVARLLTRGNAPRDVNSGFFAVNSKAMSVLNKSLLERYPEPQMYILGCRRGLRVKEIEIEQMPRKFGTSSVTLGHALRLCYRFNIFVLGEILQGSPRR